MPSGRSCRRNATTYCLWRIHYHISWGTLQQSHGTVPDWRGHVPQRLQLYLPYHDEDFLD